MAASIQLPEIVGFREFFIASELKGVPFRLDTGL